MSNTGEYFLAHDDTFLLPSNAIYRINDKLDGASDLSSIYSNEPESAIGDGHDADEIYMDSAEFAQRLYKVREIDSITSDGRTFLRLPMQWSLGQWIGNRSFRSNIGLIPSCWLIKKSFYDAAKGALNDLSMRLTSVLHLSTVDDEAQTGLQKKNNSKKDASTSVGLADVSAPPSHQEVSKVLYSKVIEQEYKDENKFSPEKEDIDPEHIEHTSLPFYIKASKRIFTLQNIVFLQQQVVHFHSVPPPFTSPTRDIYAVTMKSEQWAARHFDQTTEPALLSQTFSLISRSIFDPYKKSHMEFAHSIQLSNDVIEEARTYIKRSMSRRNAKSPKDDEAGEVGGRRDSTPDAGPTDDSVLKADTAIEIDISNLKYSPEDMLGSGAFGAVYRGKLETVDGEVISHPNVTKFYGFCYNKTKEYAMLTFELMDVGSLADFMKIHEYNISANEHIDFLTQIARGMAHLHSLDPPIVHGDLAARNVLICHHPTDETSFKWSPPEVLHRRELSTKTDVWAYAILATEIYGVIDPYGMLPNEKVLPFLKGADFETNDHRMEKPSAMPYYIYNIVLQCWRKQPVDRPTFNEIVRDLMPYYIEYESSHIILLTSRIVAESIANRKN
uniref:Protein kinase domain-containing protein n=1 Tax=Loa loa TaxID=7209 RepID=A0A1I7VWL9_LOALO